jgi:type II secretory pathway pseudopilin PulG
MSLSTDRRRARGATLIELLIAGAVLAVGSTGVMALLMSASRTSGDAGKRVEASLAGQASIEELLARPYQTLSVGTFDGGLFVGQTGSQIQYARTIRVSNLTIDPGAVDAGANSEGFLVSVDVTYRTGLFANRTQTYETIFTAPFDAGL